MADSANTGPTVQDRGDWGVTKLFGQNKYYLVIITSTKYGSVQAWLPDIIGLSVKSEWATILSSGPDALSSFFFAGTVGAVPFAQYLTAQAWKGSQPLEVVLDLQFFAVSDSVDEVIRPIRNLIRMALPRKNTSSNVISSIFQLVPPGPRVDPGGLFETFFGGGITRLGSDDINVYIGNFMRLKQVFISDINPITFKGRLSATTATDPGGLPMQGECRVTFKTTYSLTSDDMMDILLPNLVGSKLYDIRPNPTLT